MAEQTSPENIINVYSEIGKLKKVLLHRPGKELENLTPDMMERLLFDDLPYLKVAQEEHDLFAETLNNNGIEIYYLEDLAADALVSPEVRNDFIEEFLTDSKIYGTAIREALKEQLATYDNKELILKLMSGMRYCEVKPYNPKGLEEIVYSHYPFILDPLPNLYFTRDPFATIGNGITINSMSTHTRKRETIFADCIFKHNPLFAGANVPIYYNRNENTSIEGGDELILSKEVIAIGISQRTEAHSVEIFANNLFKSNASFNTILAFEFPKKRAFMHLDTVFTMIDYDKFTIHPEIEGPLRVYVITKDQSQRGLQIEQEELPLAEILKKHLNLSQVTLIRCAGGDIIDAPREQWNDGSNTLAIAPGEVIVYGRNYVTNQLLVENGIKIQQIPSSELSRGRGGPRCMSMPLFRENLE